MMPFPPLWTGNCTQVTTCAQRVCALVCCAVKTPVSLITRCSGFLSGAAPSAAGQELGAAQGGSWAEKAPLGEGEPQL